LTEARTVTRLQIRYEIVSGRHRVVTVVMFPEPTPPATGASHHPEVHVSPSAPAPALTARRKNRPARIGTGLLVAGALLLGVPSVADSASRNSDSLQELQERRSQVRSQQARQAGQVNALRATDAEVSAALAALNANVNAQQDRVEEAERAVGQAERDQANAEAAQTQAQAELDQLRAELKRSAVEAFVSMGSAQTMSTVGVGDVNDAVNKRAILSVQQNESMDLAERYRSVQEDLAIQQAAAVEAADRARAQRGEVKQRLDQLNAAAAEQQAFAEQVDQRIEAALAEAESLAAIDTQLSSSIAAKQAEIARAVAAQRAAEAARAAQREAQRKAALVRPSGGGGGGERSGGGGGGGGGGGDIPAPSITGSGEIVSVGGIRVHQSIAGNLQSLLSAAAADGIQFSGGGYRDPAGQIAVRRSNCGSSNYAIYQMPASACRPPTARPGQSMHERGLAIDFTQGGRTLTRGSAGFQWLQANAGRFGFRNLPSEPWHWSTNGQ
jgi:peptidoglycan hydrolase CwlO-like protein